MLIDNNPLTNGICYEKGMYPMGCAVPDDIMYINDSLSKELINFLKFKSGRTFDDNPYSTEDDWSKMIWDLLKIAAFKFSKRKNAQLGLFSRANEYNHFFTENMRETTLFEEALKGHNNVDKLFDENTGVSVVLVESRLKREQEEVY